MEMKESEEYSSILPQPNANAQQMTKGMQSKAQIHQFCHDLFLLFNNSHHCCVEIVIFIISVSDKDRNCVRQMW